MAKRSSGTSGSDVPSTKHRVGYDPRWRTTFPLHIAVENDVSMDSDSSTMSTSSLAVTGLLCSLCRWYHTRQRNGVGTLTRKLCTYL